MNDLIFDGMNEKNAKEKMQNEFSFTQDKKYQYEQVVKKPKPKELKIINLVIPAIVILFGIGVMFYGLLLFYSILFK